MTNKSLSGWLIHSQLSGETAVYASLLTQEQGLIKTCYPGGQSRKRKANLQLFTPLWIEIKEKKETIYCQSIEIKKQLSPFFELSLFCAYYVNELIYKVLKQPEVDSELYSVYENTIFSLQNTNELNIIEGILRKFEWSLLVSQGQAYSFEFEGDHLTPIKASHCYLFKPGYGFYTSSQGLSGKVLQTIAQNGLIDKSSLSVAKKIMRQAIDYLVNYKTIHARSMIINRIREQQ